MITSSVEDRADIKILVFDLGNVLIPFDWGKTVNALEKIDQDADKKISKVVGSDLMLSYEKGLISTEEFYQQVQEMSDWNIDFSDFMEYFANIFTCNNDLLGLFPRLRERYRLFALSNTCRMHIEWIEERFPLLKQFDELILSYQVGHVKPEKEIFDKVLKSSNLPPERHLYIDDNVDYTKVARGLGLQVHHFVSNNALLEDFRTKGIIYD